MIHRKPRNRKKVRVSETIVQVANGIYQVRLPLPFPLKIVNVYLLEERDGWTVIDAGLHYPAGCAAWEQAFTSLGIDRTAIQRVILTHCHPDHYGASGWLTAPTAAPVFCSPVERAFARLVWEDHAVNERQIVPLFLAHGMPEEIANQIDQDVSALRQLTQPTPMNMQLIESGMHVTVGGRVFEAIETPGHSDGHLVFYCADERLMLCGDAVLTKITPNVGLWSWSRPNPLADFLASLERLANFEVALALPGHQTMITNWRERLTELRQHHADRLDLAEAAADGRDGFAICQVLFDSARLSSHQMRFAMAETLAHLEYLVGVGRLVRNGAGYRRPGAS
jgi:glyoxylase-like metal-dependent hydrolase (beta-lactamase superfamily II)